MALCSSLIYWQTKLWRCVNDDLTGVMDVTATTGYRGYRENRKFCESRNVKESLQVIFFSRKIHIFFKAFSSLAVYL